MTRFPLLAAAALLPLAVPAFAQGDPAPEAAAQPELSLEQAMMLRCSAAFAIVASEQARGAVGMDAYPPLGERGKEYFVQVNARLMDELALGREEITALLTAEVKALQEEAATAKDPAEAVDRIMQPCLLALDASGI